MNAILLNIVHDLCLCTGGGYFCETCGVSGAELLPLHHPFAGIPSPCAKVDPPDSFLIDLVDHLHQRIAAGPLLLAGEQVALLDAVRGEVGQHDATFLVAVSISPDVG